MASIAPLSLDVSFKQYEDDISSFRQRSYNAETATTCSSVSGDDDIEAGNNRNSTHTSDLDSSYTSRCDAAPGYGGRPQLPRAARRSFLMYGDAPKRESTISLPTHVESTERHSNQSSLYSADLPSLKYQCISLLVPVS